MGIRRLRLYSLFVGDVCSPNVKEPVPKQNICNTVLWLISTNGEGLQILSLHCIMHNFFHWFRFGFGSLYG